MPTIKLPERKSYNNYKWKHYSKRDNKIHKNIYNTSRWKEMRINYLVENPLCKRCFHKGIIASAIDVHHSTPISTAGDDVQMILVIGFDKNNLESLCKECHKDAHNKK